MSNQKHKDFDNSQSVGKVQSEGFFLLLINSCCFAIHASWKWKIDIEAATFWFFAGCSFIKNLNETAKLQTAFSILVQSHGLLFFSGHGLSWGQQGFGHGGRHGGGQQHLLYPVDNMWKVVQSDFSSNPLSWRFRRKDKWLKENYWESKMLLKVPCTLLKMVAPILYDGHTMDQDLCC